MIDRIKKNNCNGCKLCKDICPTGAITYAVDYEGFWYPKVDESLCVSCEKCLKRCPVFTKQKSNMSAPIIKAAWTKDDQIRLASTSGGIFYELARHVLGTGGYVVGCVYTEDFKGAKHVLIHTMEELPSLMVSKYLQSDTEDIYRQTAEAIKTGKNVLFVGAPCHCAAMKSFLGREAENLILCDFICRGANSPKAHRKYVEYLESQFSAPMTSLRSKDKRNGWNRFGQSATFQNGKEYFADRNTDLRIVAYHHGNLMMRPSCHDCQFKTLPRIADISLGDFWAIDAARVKDVEKGVSLVMLNSLKGQELFKAISNRIDQVDSSLSEVEKGNKALHESATKGKNRDAFLQELDDVPFDALVAKYRDREVPRVMGLLRRLKSKILQILH